MTRLSRLREELRQRRHHRAFRIEPPIWDEAARAQLERLLTEISAPVEPESTESTVDEKDLANAATNLWRAQRRLARDAEDSRSRQTGRYLNTCRDALHDAGLVIQDHDGDLHHPGRSIEVLVYKDDPALTHETVLETVRPTIYLRDRRIQLGQVIVGCPPSQDETR